MRKRLPLIAAAVFAQTACGESEPGVDEQRQAAREAFADNTPGTLEMADAALFEKHYGTFDEG